MKKAILSLALGTAALSCDARAEAFVGAAAGMSDWPSDVCSGAASCDRHDTAWTLRAGYMFMPYVGVEARYVDLGRARNSRDVFGLGMIDARFAARGAGVGLVLAAPLNDALRITGVVGAARMESTSETFDAILSEGETGIVVPGMRTSETKTNPYYGVGVDYALRRDLSVGLEATRYRVRFGGNADIDAITANVTYHFR
jgi:hypothetical protein